MLWLISSARINPSRMGEKMTNQDVFEKIREILVETFELNAESIKRDSHLFNDLDLDSIDAVDLVVRLQEYTGKKIDPDVFKSVRTIDDVIDAVLNILNDETVA